METISYTYYNEYENGKLKKSRLKQIFNADNNQVIR